MASILLPVPQILQNPELPNGCEITSCCEVLHYLGFAPDKCELADYYLPRSAQWYGADPDEVYMGNPHLDDGSPETGYYCFAGPIVQAANAYLAVQGSSCRAYDLTGAEEAELASQLQAGNPVIFGQRCTLAISSTTPAVNTTCPVGGGTRCCTPCTAWCCAAWMTRTLWWQTRWILTVWYRVSSS